VNHSHNGAVLCPSSNFKVTRACLLGDQQAVVPGCQERAAGGTM
jgi:hypothetical protein